MWWNVKQNKVANISEQPMGQDAKKSEHKNNHISFPYLVLTT